MGDVEVSLSMFCEEFAVSPSPGAGELPLGEGGRCGPSRSRGKSFESGWSIKFVVVGPSYFSVSSSSRQFKSVTAVSYLDALLRSHCEVPFSARAKLFGGPSVPFLFLDDAGRLELWHLRKIRLDVAIGIPDQVADRHDEYG